MSVVGELLILTMLVGGIIAIVNRLWLWAEGAGSRWPTQSNVVRLDL
jgi:hypothetical protein